MSPGTRDLAEISKSKKCIGPQKRRGRRCLLCAVCATLRDTQPWVAQPWTLGQEHWQRYRSRATHYAGKVDKTFPSRFQFVKTRIGRRPVGDSDVSCVPYGPWDKSSGSGIDIEGGEVCESPMSPVCCPRIAYRVSRSVAQPWVAQPWTLGQELWLWQRYLSRPVRKAKTA